MPPKRRRYNWKARQQARGKTRKTSESANVQMESYVQVDAKRHSFLTTTDDSNAIVLPPRKRKTDRKEQLGREDPKRSRLSNKERKKIKKIAEAKEKKSKVSWLF